MPEHRAVQALVRCLQTGSGQLVVREAIGSIAELEALPPDAAVLVVQGQSFLATIGSLPTPPDWLAAPLPIASAGDAPVPALGLRRQGRPSDAAMEAIAQVRALQPRTGPTVPVADELGLAMHLICRARRARRVVELGTGGGALAIWLGSAVAATHGRLVSIEKDSAQRIRATAALKRAGLSERVRLALGDAPRMLAKLDGPIDMGIMDHTYEERVDDMERLLGLLGPGGLLVSTDSSAAPDSLSRLNALLRTRPEFSDVVNVAVGSGLTLARVA